MCLITNMRLLMQSSVYYSRNFQLHNCVQIQLSTNEGAWCGVSACACGGTWLLKKSSWIPNSRSASKASSMDIISTNTSELPALGTG